MRCLEDLPEELSIAGHPPRHRCAYSPFRNYPRAPAWRFLSGALLLCGFLLPGCSTLSRSPVSVDPAKVTTFDLTGRVNVRVESKSYPGRIHWQHAPGSDEVWLYSPVGTGIARMRQDGSGALLITSDGKEYRADDLRLLARKVLGWDMPLDGLQYWVRGIEWPALNAAQQEYDNNGRPKLLTQGEWRVAYLDWAPAGVSGLPSKLDLSGEGLRLRLVVDQWKVDGTGR